MPITHSMPGVLATAVRHVGQPDNPKTAAARSKRARRSRHLVVAPPPEDGEEAALAHGGVHGQLWGHVLPALVLHPRQGGPAASGLGSGQG